MSALAGTWELIRAETGGEDSPDLLALRVELELSADSYVVRFAGNVADRGTLSSDTTGTPHAFTLLGAEGPNQGRTIPCIYQLAGDRLRVCYGLDGKVPIRFKTSAGSAHYLASYRRKSAPT